MVVVDVDDHQGPKNTCFFLNHPRLVYDVLFVMPKINRNANPNQFQNSFDSSAQWLSGPRILSGSLCSRAGQVSISNVDAGLLPSL